MLILLFYIMFLSTFELFHNKQTTSISYCTILSFGRLQNTRGPLKKKNRKKYQKIIFENNDRYQK